MLDAEDIDAFFDEDMPGYSLAAQDSVEVPGLFAHPYQNQFDVSSSIPTFTCATYRAEDLDLDGEIVIDTITYTIPEVMPATGGKTVLRLHKAA